MVEWSIAAFRAASVAAVLVACPPGHVLGEPEGGAAVSGENGEEATSGKDEAGSTPAALTTVEGGETRSESVANALAEVGTELVAIHDAARPLLTAALVEEVVGALVADPDAAGAIAAAPITDTVKQAAGSSAGDPSSTLVASYGAHRQTNSPLEVERTLDRDRLWAAQTPQVFRVDALRAALEAGGEAVGSATDEAMLVEAAGGRVLICPAPPENLKVTTPRDLRLAEQLLEERRVQEGGAQEESSAK
jgi:2-C-methyl-D-erythritol 4-phosphate cytidylyltransferase